MFDRICVRYNSSDPLVLTSKGFMLLDFSTHHTCKCDIPTDPNSKYLCAGPLPVPVALPGDDLWRDEVSPGVRGSAHQRVPPRLQVLS